MSSAPFFLAGAVCLAVVGSLLVWLVSRPRQRTGGHHDMRRTLRALSRGHPGYRGTGGRAEHGVRVLPPERPGSPDAGGGVGGGPGGD